MAAIQSEQDSLDKIKQIADKEKPEVPPVNPLDPEVTLNDVALPDLTDGFTGNKKLTRKMGFQFVFLGTFVLAALAMVRGCTSLPGSQPEAQSNASAKPMSEDDRQEYEQTINHLTLALQRKEQGNRLNLRTGKGKTPLPKPAVKGSTVNRVNQSTKPKRTRRQPPRSATTARTIPVRRSVPRFQPTAHRPPSPPPPPPVAHREPPKPKPQPVQSPPPRLKPVNRISLSKKYEPPQVKVTRRQPPIKIKPYRPTKALRPSPTQPPPRIQKGVLIASNRMTGDLMKDMAAPYGEASPEGGSSSPTPTLPTGASLAAGSKAKAEFINPLSWVNRGDSITGQHLSIRLKEDLGSYAKKGSLAIGEVTSVQGDIVQVQVIEINGQPIQPGNAIIQHKNTPYLIAKPQSSGGPNLGNRLLRAGLNVGIDQMRGSNIGDRAGNVVNSLVPQQNSRRQSSPIFSFEGKDVEIYVVEGI